MYNNELMINILMEDGHTREEAEKFDVFLMNSHNCVIFKSIEELNQCFDDIDIDSIRAGKFESFSAVNYQGKEYYIEYLR